MDLRKTKPILFNTEMVKALLEGRKTVTRRLLKPQPEFLEGETGTPERCDDGNWCFKIDQYANIYDFDYKPPYQPGDILYVRETWAPYCINKKTCPNHLLGHSDYCFKASPESAYYGCVDDFARELCKWHPSIHMPKEAARIFLRVKRVRVDRLQAMTEADARKEGVFFHPEMQTLQFSADKHDGPTAVFWGTAMEAFRYNIWDDTISKEERSLFGWDANPWVWVIEFERCEKPEDYDHGK